MRILKYLIRGIVVIFLALTLKLIYQDITAEKLTTPSILGYSFLVVIGDSMENTLQDKDLIIIKKKNNYQVDDIITFYAEIDDAPARITHRIIDNLKSEEIYITRGDKYADFKLAPEVNEYLEEVQYEDVIGKVVLKIPWVGSILSLSIFQNKTLVLILLIIFILLTIVFYILHLFENRKYIR